jgi:integrase
MRLGELLSTRHCDWHAGRGGTPFIEVVPRQDHPAGVRCKSSRYRRIYISDELERLHSGYVWQLCDAGAHQAVDLAGHFVFVNLRRGQWLAPMRPETVYDKVAALKRMLGDAVPAGWTPHWFRHTHASALLLSGAREHVVMRRLGHADIQTTLNLYGNSRELHQPGEKPQVSRSRQGRDSVRCLRTAAVRPGKSQDSSRLMQDPSAEGSRWSEGLSSSASRKRRVGWLGSGAQAGHSDSWNNRLRHYG